MRKLKLSKKAKLELACAVVMAIVFSSSSILLYSRQKSDYGSDLYINSMERSSSLNALTDIQQTIHENIEGELNIGSFETVIKNLRNITDSYDGRIPYLDMQFRNDLWHGTANCKIPTGNVAFFAIDVRYMIGENGKVTYIGVTVSEEEINQTSQTEAPMSTVTIALKEVSSGSSPLLSHMGEAVSWLVTPLMWIVEGLLVVVPLSFVSLGIVMLFDRGIIPLWKKQFKNRNLTKPAL